MMPKELRNSPAVKEIARYGCGTFMHIVRINANAHKNDDLLREIDFTTAGIGRRWRAGYEDAMRTLERRPWEKPIDPMAGVAVHDSDAPDLPNKRAAAPDFFKATSIRNVQSAHNDPGEKSAVAGE
jgi:NTE family protein